MSCYASFMFLFLFSFLSSFRASAQIPDPTFLRIICPNTTTYSRNSTYFTNLRTVLSSLSSRNASYSTRFQNATAGQEPDRVTGIFLCRGDVSPEVCRNCVGFAVNNTLIRCPNQKETVLYYDECMLRYSNQNILSTVSLGSGARLTNSGKVTSTQLDRFRDFVLSKLNQAAIEAASSPTKFSAIKSVPDPSAITTIYGLVQCTPDLTRQNCLTCLQQCNMWLDSDRLGARIILPSCSSRFELYSFFNESAIRSPPPPPPSQPASIPPLSAPPRSGKRGNSSLLVVGIVVPIIVVVLLFIAGYQFLVMRAKKTAPVFNGDDITTIQSLQLDYKTIQAATNDFSENNKIGQGGFGEVFKGTFSNGNEVAVKRLSKTSGQGETEFKNEVVVVAKLQHKNLVRLLGFSLEGEERILVYEYVPNKSLDYFLFDHTKRGQLDWTRRQQIIGGIARGILYLHQDSRLTVIHRDLKASNILLDADMNPKIADFGMARIFGLDQTQENTGRIVGTLGYMPPEYARHGQISMKSDVYSFGVLVLELISGRKNSSFSGTDGANDLLTYAYMLWSNGTALDFVDAIIFDNCRSNEMLRYIHISLLCVQEDPIERPTLSTISVMLTSNTVTLPLPRKPGFFVQSDPKIDPLDADQSTTTKSVPVSVESTSSDLYPPEYDTNFHAGTK